MINITETLSLAISLRIIALNNKDILLHQNVGLIVINSYKHPDAA